jgi:hypothetical protein
LVPGTQLPVHAPLTHAELTQATGVLHCPEVHVCTPLPEHWVPLLQAPVHAPLEQVPLGQGCSLPQVPSASQVSTPPELPHWTCPGVHEPPHALSTHTCAQLIALPQVPVALHVSCCVALVHWVAAGAHVPVHVPAEHAWLAHGEPIGCQAPAGPHSCGCCPLHPSVPATHATHAPPWHTGVLPEQAWPRFCHCPLALQN